MGMGKKVRRTTMVLAAVWAGTPLITSVSCDPIRGLSIFRYDDYEDSFFYDGYHDDGCFLFDCYFHDEFLFFY